MWLALLFACGSPPADPVVVVEPAPAAPAAKVVLAPIVPPAAPLTESPARDCVEEAIKAAYGESSAPNLDPRPDALVPLVSVHRRDDHVVYVTHGAIRQTFPHEFVLRLRDAAEVAPTWPADLLREIAEAEVRRGEVFRPRGLLGDITLPGIELPYRNVVFQMDPVLKGLQCGETFVGFVQVLLFNDPDWAAMKAIPEGEINTVLKARFDAEPLGIAP